MKNIKKICPEKKNYKTFRPYEAKNNLIMDYKNYTERKKIKQQEILKVKEE